MGRLTLANQLTILRIMLIPAFVLLVVYGYLGWALVTFLAAGTTDALDGLIARRTGQRTALGAWLDPMADKLLLVTTTVFVISRDTAIVGVVAIVSLAIGPRTFRPSIWGKLATATYIVTSVVIMYYNYRREQALVVDIFLWASLALTLISGIDYFIRLRRLINEPAE